MKTRWLYILSLIMLFSFNSSFAVAETSSESGLSAQVYQGNIKARTENPQQLREKAALYYSRLLHEGDGKEESLDLPSTSPSPKLDSSHAAD